jgi:hypothetical protein
LNSFIVIVTLCNKEQGSTNVTDIVLEAMKDEVLNALDDLDIQPAQAFTLDNFEVEFSPFFSSPTS